MLRITPYLLLILGGLLATTAQATHIRAGEIIVERVPADQDASGRAVDITLFVYWDTNSPVENEWATFTIFPQFPANSQSIAQIRVNRQSVTNIGNRTTVAVFQTRYVFPTNTSFLVTYKEQNRNTTVTNLDRPADQAFYVETAINLELRAANRSPLLANPPIDLAVVGQRYIHNPGAIDADGDSLSYEAVDGIFQPYIDRNLPAPVFRQPDDPLYGGQQGLTCGGIGTGPSSFRIYNQGDALVENGTYDPGDVVWDTPGRPGEFNVAFRIVEWRRLPDGQFFRIGSVVRDMQILVSDDRNCPPTLNLNPICIVGGLTATTRVTADDPDGDRISLSITGEAFEDFTPTERPEFQAAPLQLPTAEGVLSWPTGCQHIRQRPYEFSVRAEDARPGNQVSLSTYGVLTVKVVGPSPTGLTAEGISGGVDLAWDAYTCPQADSFVVYRRTGPRDLPLDTCAPGVEPASGFLPIATLPISQLAFRDETVQPGPVYTYALTARFPAPDGEESLVSDTATADLPLDVPLLFRVSVLTTDPDDGQIELTWLSPLEIDSMAFPPPYTYAVERLVGDDFVEITRTTDTTFTDQGLDTENQTMRYRIGLYSVTTGDTLSFRDHSPEAGSVRLTATGGINQIALGWTAQVPWDNGNRFHLVFRQDPGQDDFFLRDSVEVTGGENFAYVDNDPALITSEVYAYVIETRGSFGRVGLPSPLFNLSQEATARPEDTLAPCPPVLEVLAQDCPECLPGGGQQIIATRFTNFLSWTGPDSSPLPPDATECDARPAFYLVYYAPRQDEPLELLVRIEAPDTTFDHPDLLNRNGCYAVSAVDEFGNESALSNTVCVEECFLFELPNVFTPDNGDNVNEFFEPKCVLVGTVRRVELDVVDRWGRQIHRFVRDGQGEEVSRRYWDGRTPQNQPAPAGVYYYTITITFESVGRPDERRTLKGWVQILR